MRPFVAAIVPAATLCFSVAVAPPATADSPNRTFGGCGFDANRPAVVGGNTYTGVIYEDSATLRPDGTPIDATVSCKIQVNFVDAPGTEFDFPGFGTQGGADPVSFTASDTDIVALCQRTIYVDGTMNDWSCPTSIPAQIPPQEWIDDLNFLLGVVANIETWDVDSRLCPIFAAHPGTYGPITIKPDGDIYAPDPTGLTVGPFYDCPPYGNF